jgi:hypothetical protein
MRKHLNFCLEKRSDCWGVVTYQIVSSRGQFVASLKVESGDATALERCWAGAKKLDLSAPLPPGTLDPRRLYRLPG